MTAPGDHVFVVQTRDARARTIGELLAQHLRRPYLDDEKEIADALLRGPSSVIGLSREKASQNGAGELSNRAGQFVVFSGANVALTSVAANSANLVVSLDGRSDETVVKEIAAMLRRRVTVALGTRSYDVLIGPRAREELLMMLPRGAKRCAIVTQEEIDYEVDPGIESFRFVIPDGEQAKSLATIEQLCRSFSNAGLTRADVIVGVGGGVVTDVAGFAAACYHRGIAVVHVATTLLAQIDAAIGGKTGVNLPEGKNLVGAFWQPSAVICDTDTLATLSERERRSGLGEMAKYAFLGLEELDELPLVEQVARCVALKAAVVAADEREGDARANLNYGHTLAHALEAAGFADGPGRSGVDLRHGEAVAIGLVFAARLAQMLGRIDEARVARHRDIVRSYELPFEIPRAVDHDELLMAMGRDKKATDGLTFVLDGPRGVETVRGVSSDLVLAAMQECTEANGNKGEVGM